MIVHTKSFEMMWKPEEVFHDEKNELITFVQQQSADNREVVLFLTLFWEPHPTTAWIERFNSTVDEIKQLGNVRVIFACNVWYQYYSDLLDSSSADAVLYIPFFMITVHNRIFNIGKMPVNTKWNTDAEQFLFLIGKPQKQHRIRMLYKILSAGLRSRLEWSFFMPDGARDACHALIPELTAPQFDQFVTEHLRSPDDISVFMMDDSLHYSGIPFDSRLFKNSLFQIISECYWDHPGEPGLWATEKTWISIVNRQPFIMVSDTNSLTRLEEWGFRTFTQYLKVPDYDQITDKEQRLDAVLENIKHWNSNILDYKDAIDQDIKHNYQHYMRVVDKRSQILQQEINQLGLNINMFDAIPFSDQTQNARWSRFYNNVKDPSWPECNYEEAFYTLPESIQKECIEIFGFKPVDI